MRKPKLGTKKKMRPVAKKEKRPAKDLKATVTKPVLGHQTVRK